MNFDESVRMEVEDLKLIPCIPTYTLGMITSTQAIHTSLNVVGPLISDTIKIREGQKHLNAFETKI